uniref:Bet v I/Major latex protein domain-containing protein n=1 Tax=Kalanchoe fedtschenkoi TaxID=63787 RepID=A0A7N0UJL8_KALFE
MDGVQPSFTAVTYYSICDLSEAFCKLECVQMAVKGKIEDRVEIKTSGQEFHDVFNGKPHHLANISPEKIHGCTLHSGDLGSTGSTIEWHYTHEGVKKSTKQIIEVDDGKYKVVYKITEGHFSEEYSNFHIIYDAIPKPDGGTIVHWIFEFEKPGEETPDPTSLLEYLCDLTKDIDAHIQEVAAAAKN